MIKKRQVITFIRYAVILLFGITMIFPFLWMLSASVKEPIKVFEKPIVWIAENIQFQNYSKLFTYYEMHHYIANTLKLTFLNIVGTVISCSIVAYSLAFMKFRGKKIIMGLLLATMMLPGTVTFFPQFILYVKLGWYGTLLPLWLPSFFGNAFYIFLLRQYFLTIPRSIIEAGRVAGANDLTMLIKIVLPMAKPVFIMMILQTFIGCWTDLFGPLIYILNQSDQTLSLMLTYLNASYGTVSTIPSVMAGGIISIIPLLIVYFISQKNMIKGIQTLSGNK